MTGTGDFIKNWANKSSTLPGLVSPDIYITRWVALVNRFKS